MSITRIALVEGYVDAIAVDTAHHTTLVLVRSETVDRGPLLQPVADYIEGAGFEHISTETFADPSMVGRRAVRELYTIKAA